MIMMVVQKTVIAKLYSNTNIFHHHDKNKIKIKNDNDEKNDVSNTILYISNYKCNKNV